jgi:hypothetical protein
MSKLTDNEPTYELHLMYTKLSVFIKGQRSLQIRKARNDYSAVRFQNGEKVLLYCKGKVYIRKKGAMNKLISRFFATRFADKQRFIQLPPVQQQKSTWYGRDLAVKQSEWLLPLSQGEVFEIESAASALMKTNFDLAKIQKDDFPLPILSRKLHQLKNELIFGHGFAVLRNLPVQKYSEREAAAIFLGLGVYLGSLRSQNAQGHILGHVKDLGFSSNDPNIRIYQTHERQTFHTDSCDVVGLLCLKPAKSGGESLLVSASTVYNEMLARSPHLLPYLLSPIPTDRRGETPPGMVPYLLIPVLSYYDNHITPFYQRQYIESSQRFEEAPRLTAEHYMALDAFDELCNDQTMHLSMSLQQGDIQFVHNHSLLHDRTAFCDDDDKDDSSKLTNTPTATATTSTNNGQSTVMNGRLNEKNKETRKVRSQRHLLRLWLSVAGDRLLPDVFSTRYGSIKVGDRGGIVLKDGQVGVVPMSSELILSR